MAAEWLKPRPLPGELADVRDRVGSPLGLRLAVLAFVWAFAAGTAVQEWEAASVVVGAGAALIGIVAYVRAMRIAGAEHTNRAIADWLLYRPEPGAPVVELAVFALLGAGLAVTIVAALVRITGG